MKNLSVGTVPLGTFDQDWFVVMSKLSNKSVRANVANLIEEYVSNNKEKYQQILEYTARRHGITKEVCFSRLLNNEDLGEPVENFDAMPPVINDEG